MGYCVQPPMLVYEFMEEGSLGDKLFQEVIANGHALLVQLCFYSLADLLSHLEPAMQDLEGCVSWFDMAAQYCSPPSTWRCESVSVCWSHITLLHLSY